MNYKIERSREEINSTGGISLAGLLMRKVKLFNVLNDRIMGKTKSGRISHSSILRSMVALFCEGRNDYSDIGSHKDDIVFQESLDLEAIASEGTLRQRLDQLSETMDDEILKENMKVLSLVDNFGEESTNLTSYTPVSLDVTPLDNTGSKKENVGRTYKGCDGFAPMMAYVGTEGYLLNCELRPGTQHSQKGMDGFLPQTIESIRTLGVENALYVLDSAHDAAENIEIFQERESNFLIKRNLRFEVPEQRLGLAR